jgi:hypothetical protein
MTDYRPRLSIEISQEKAQKLRKYLPHGQQKVVFNLVIDDLINLFEEFGAGKVIGAFVCRDITLKDICKYTDLSV